MITSALALPTEYKKLTLPVTIIAGEGDKVAFKRMSERLACAFPNNALQVVPGAGHMVHYFAARQVAQAIDNVAANLFRTTPAQTHTSR